MKRSTRSEDARVTELVPVTSSSAEEEQKKQHTKRQRLHPGAISAEEPWNLLMGLPYVVLSHLLDFLSPASAGGTDGAEGPTRGVPEPLRVRAEGARRQQVFKWGRVRVPPDRKDEFRRKCMAQDRRLRATRPYHIPTTRQAHQQASWSHSISALRLVCRDIKLAVDDALRLDRHGVDASLLSAGPRLDRFLADQFRSSLSASSASDARSSSEAQLPLLSDTPEASRAKAQFRQMADIMLSTAQARLHQARLGEVLEYVWSQWRLPSLKLSALRQQLLSPRSVTARPSQMADALQENVGQPLLVVEYLQREDDYLGQSYALGINACLSLGLPDMPHERVEIQLGVLQAWDHRDDGWDLQVFMNLHTSSDAWRQRLSSPAADGAVPYGEGETKAECTKRERTLQLVLLDYNRSRGYMQCKPSVRFDVLRRLWQCVGLGDGAATPSAASQGGGSEGGGGGDDLRWSGTEVLTTLLACLGFAWKKDVDLLWDDCIEDGESDDEDEGHNDDEDQEEEEDVEEDDEEGEPDEGGNDISGGGTSGGQTGNSSVTPGLFPLHAINHELLKTSREKRSERSKMRQQAVQLNELIDSISNTNIGLVPNQAGRIRSLELMVRRIRRFIGQQRLARATSHIAMGAQEAGYPACLGPSALSRLDGYDVAKQLRVIYVHTMNLDPGEYSSFSDSTVELAWRISADALRRVQAELLSSSSSSSSPAMMEHADDQAVGSLPTAAVDLVIGVSVKMDDCYTGAHGQTMVTARVVGHHPQLRATLERLVASAVQPKCGRDLTPAETAVDASEMEEEGIVLHQVRHTGGLADRIMATEALEFVGRLLGLSLRSDVADSNPATSAPAGDERDTGTTQFAESVLAFMAAVARATTWDAEEGTFPVCSDLRQMWQERIGNDDFLTDAVVEPDNGVVLQREMELAFGPPNAPWPPL